MSNWIDDPHSVLSFYPDEAPWKYYFEGMLSHISGCHDVACLCCRTLKCFSKFPSIFEFLISLQPSNSQGRRYKRISIDIHRVYDRHISYCSFYSAVWFQPSVNGGSSYDFHFFVQHQKFNQFLFYLYAMRHAFEPLVRLKQTINFSQYKSIDRIETTHVH